MAQDSFFMHHPDPSITRDKFLNVPGGDSFYDVVSDWQQPSSWDILNTFTVDTAWDILNDFDQDTAWDILNTFAQATAWDILNDAQQPFSWNIFEFNIPSIANFIIHELRSTYNLDVLTSTFKVCPIDTNFTVDSVISDNVSIKENNTDMSFTINQIQDTFTLKYEIQTNFKIFRVMDEVLTPY